MKEPSFSKEDVWAVARVVADSDNWHSYMDTRNDYYYCVHCDQRNYSSTKSADIAHAAKCPVLIARDLLTGAP